MPPATGPTTNDMIWTIPATGGTLTCLTRDYDREIGGGVGGDFAQGGLTSPIQWTPDGMGLLFMVGRPGHDCTDACARDGRRSDAGCVG